MRKFFKLLTLKMTILVSFMLIPLSSFAVVIDELYYGGLNRSSKTICCYGPNNCSSYTGEEVSIREYVTIDNIQYKVIKVSGFSRLKSLKKIIFPESIEEISASAFLGCENLCGTIKLPKNLKKIGKSAFKNCKKITKIEGTNSCVLIPENCFWGCENLTDVIFPSCMSIGKDAFNGCKNLNSMIVSDDMNEIQTNAFMGCENLEKFVNYEGEFPHRISYFGDNAFSGCLNLSCSLEFDNSVFFGSNSFFNAKRICGLRGNLGSFEISPGAFEGCSNIQYIYYPKDQRIIENVKYLSKLEEVYIPENVEVIKEASFRSCKSLTKVTNRSKKLKRIELYSFDYCDKLEDFDIPQCTSIDWRGAFYGSNGYSEANGLKYFHSKIIGVSKLQKSYTIPSKKHIEMICADVFADNPTVKKIMFEDNYKYLKTIGNGCFKGCYNLDTIGTAKVSYNIIYSEDGNLDKVECFRDTVFLDKFNVEAIGDSAFSGCHKFCVSIPTNVLTIQAGTFSGCLSYNDELVIPDNVITIEDEAFANILYANKLVIGANVKNISSSSFMGLNSSLTEIVVDRNNHYFSGGQYLIDKNLHKLIVATSNCTAIPNDIEEIGSCCFSNRKDLVQFKLPSKIKRICNEAFSHCINLESLIYNYNGNSAISIGDFAFFNCKKLNLSDAFSQNVGDIGSFAFAKCAGLTKFNASERLTSIGMHAFDNCTKLTTMGIMSGVREIGVYAFKNCRGIINVDLSNSDVEHINKGVFYSCKRLKNLLLPSSIEYVDDYAFYECNLSNLSFIGGEAPSLAFVGRFAFAKTQINDWAYKVECFKDNSFASSALGNLLINSCTNNIGYRSFANCVLANVDVYQRIPLRISHSVFTFNAEMSEHAYLFVPNGCSEAFRNAEVWCNFRYLESRPDYVRQRATSVSSLMVDNDDSKKDKGYNVQGIMISPNLNNRLIIKNGKKIIK